MVNSPQIGQFLKFVEELLKIKLHQRTTFIRALLCRCKTATTCKLQAFIEPQLDQMGFNIAAACSVCHKKLLLLLLLLLLYPNLSGTHCQQCNLSSSAKNGCRINCINKQQDGLYRRKKFLHYVKEEVYEPFNKCREGKSNYVFPQCIADGFWYRHTVTYAVEMLIK